MRSIPYQELRPREAEFRLNGKTYVLKPFSIAVRVWCRTEFATKAEPNGLQNLTDRLKNAHELDVDAVTRCAYELMIDKSDFPTYQSFVESIDTKTAQIDCGRMMTAICASIGLSQSHIEESARSVELKKSLPAERVKARRQILHGYLTASQAGTAGRLNSFTN